MLRARPSRNWLLREALPPPRFHAPVTQHNHALGRVIPKPAVGTPAPATAPHPGCAATAQIAHIKYAAQYALLVRIRVRTGSWFAPQRRKRQRAYLEARILRNFEISKWWFPVRFPRYGSLVDGDRLTRFTPCNQNARRQAPANPISRFFWFYRDDINTKWPFQHVGSGPLQKSR